MKFLKTTGKILGAGITAAAILCVFSFFYYRTPMCVASTLGNTDYVWPANSSWSQMVEGISHGKFDAWGFHNPQVTENPDILLLGSSHMEATYVSQEELLTVQLEKLLGGRASAYNMGISGCHLPQTLQYLPKTLEVYDTPPRLILIEAHDLYLSEDQVTEILEGSIPSIFAPKPAWQEPIYALPYLRLLAQQKNLGLFTLLNPPRRPRPQETFELPGEPLPEDAPEGRVYDPLFDYLKELQHEYGVKFLIFYQPKEELQKDGSALFLRDPWIQVFSRKCREYGIAFLDVTEQFEQMYRQEHLVPHGFSTGLIGSGHLNANGHRAIAQAVYGWILAQEEQ